MTSAAQRERNDDGLTGAHLFLQQEMTGAVRIDVAGGQLAVFSRGNPARERVNQDAAALLPVSERRLVLVVADGVGGARSGARASSLAVAEISRALAEARAAAPDGDLGGDLLRGAILNGIEQANSAVKALGLGAGTTLAIVAIDDDRTMRTFHVGDSTVLVVGQRGRVKLQTVSHSPVGYGVEAGLIDDDDALHHPDLHLISNMVGSERMRIEVGARLSLLARDTLLVASDGIFDNLYMHEVVEQIRCGPLEHAAAALIGQANARMQGRADEDLPSKADDMTFILYRLRPPKRPRRAKKALVKPAASKPTSKPAASKPSAKPTPSE